MPPNSRKSGGRDVKEQEKVSPAFEIIFVSYYIWNSNSITPVNNIRQAVLDPFRPVSS
jgi:hypothetical protein